MRLTKDQRDKMKDILENVDKNVGPGEAIALAVKMMALQVNLLDAIAGELSSIDASIQRAAARM